MKSTKEHLIASIIVVMSFIIIGISGSYAYYENTINGSTSINIGSGANDLVINFETLNGQYINVASSALIADENITDTEQYTSFSVSLPNDAGQEEATYSLYLTDISMTDNFKSEDLKWALYDDFGNIITDNVGNAVEGNLENVTLNSVVGYYDANENGVQDVDEKDIYSANNILLYSNTISATGEAQKYRLYIWLSYRADKLQNDLLKGSLEAKVGFKAVAN